MGQEKFVVGDLVFAKVRGFPFWPARITSLGNNGKYNVFFFGTYEVAAVQKKELQHFTPELKEQHTKTNHARKGYLKGLQELEETPDIGMIEEMPETIAVTAKLETEAKAAATVVIKKPLKLEDGTPVSPKKGVKRPAAVDTEAAPKKQIKTDDSPVVNSPSTVSR